MLRLLSLLCFSLILFFGCSEDPQTESPILGPQSQIIVSMIEAVNQKDAKAYVRGFAPDVQVFVESEEKISNRQNLMANRSNHFQSHPHVRSEIQHLVEIDNRVIMHDKVWLDESDIQGQDIVEIFTFRDGEVIRVDVIQPQDLFR
ncbi:MAG: nuclear transport factor 2 family protein [Bacteroidota bacterium]